MKLDSICPLHISQLIILRHPFPFFYESQSRKVFIADPGNGSCAGEIRVAHEFEVTQMVSNDAPSDYSSGVTVLCVDVVDLLSISSFLSSSRSLKVSLRCLFSPLNLCCEVVFSCRSLAAVFCSLVLRAFVSASLSCCSSSVRFVPVSCIGYARFLKLVLAASAFLISILLHSQSVIELLVMCSSLSTGVSTTMRTWRTMLLAVKPVTELVDTLLTGKSRDGVEISRAGVEFE